MLQYKISIKYALSPMFEEIQLFISWNYNKSRYLVDLCHCKVSTRSLFQSKRAISIIIRVCRECGPLLSHGWNRFNGWFRDRHRAFSLSLSFSRKSDHDSPLHYEEAISRTPCCTGGRGRRQWQWWRQRQQRRRPRRRSRRRRRPRRYMRVVFSVGSVASERYESVRASEISRGAIKERAPSIIYKLSVRQFAAKKRNEDRIRRNDMMIAHCV